MSRNAQVEMMHRRPLSVVIAGKSEEESERDGQQLNPNIVELERIQRLNHEITEDEYIKWLQYDHLRPWNIQNGSYRPFGMYILWCLFCLVVYYCSARVGLALQAAINVSPVWPPTGVAMVIVFRYGYNMWWVLTLGAFIGNLESFLASGFPFGDSFLSSVIIGTGNALEGLIGVFLYFMLVKSNKVVALPPCHKPKSAGVFLVASCLVAPMVSASMGLLGLFVNGIEGSLWLWGVWWSGNVMGAMIFVPVGVVVVHTIPNGFRTLDMESLLCSLYFIEFWVLVIASTFFHVLLYTDVLIVAQSKTVTFISFPFIFWGAVRFGLIGSTSQTLIILCMVTASYILGTGPFFESDNDEDTSIILLSLFLGTTSGIALVIAVAFTDLRNEGEWNKHLRRILERSLSDARNANEDMRFNQHTVEMISQVLRASHRTTGPADFIENALKVLVGAKFFVRASYYNMYSTKYRETAFGTSNSPSEQSIQLQPGNVGVVSGSEILQFMIQSSHHDSNEDPDATPKSMEVEGERHDQNGGTDKVNPVTSFAMIKHDVLKESIASLHAFCVACEHREGMSSMYGGSFSNDDLRGVVEHVQSENESDFVSSRASAGTNDSNADEQRVLISEKVPGFDIQISSLAARAVPLFDAKHLYGILVVELRPGETWTMNNAQRLRSVAACLMPEIREAFANKRADMEHDYVQAVAQMANETVHSKTLFLGNVSHELRTPLHGLCGMISLLRQSELDERQREYLNDMHRSVDQLSVVTGDLLDYSLLEANGLLLQNMCFDIREVVQSAMDLVYDKSTFPSVDYQIKVEKPVPAKMVGDCDRYRQILVNCLSNAFKYSPDGVVKVIVRLAHLDLNKSLVVIKTSVSDTGPGIDKSLLRHIFEPFTQTHMHPNRKFGGIGLGLSLSRGLARAMGGDMWCHSDVGIGSTFHFTATFSLNTEEQQDTTAINHYYPMEEIVEQQKEIIPQTLIEDRENVNLLIAEDDVINQKILSKLLCSLGFTKHEIVPNGQAAIDLAKKHHFDIFLMDCQMPVMDGIEATRILRQIAVAPCYFIAISASLPCGEDGLLFDYLLSKPYSLHQLENVMSHFHKAIHNHQIIST